MNIKNKVSVDDVLSNSQQSKKAFVEKRKVDESEKYQIIEKAGEIFLKKHFKDISPELFDQFCRRIVDISLAQMVNLALEKKHCPWLNVPDEKWDCGKSGCVKGGEAHCKTIEFINCPAINHYFKNQISMKLAVKMKKKLSADKKEEARKKIIN